MLVLLKSFLCIISARKYIDLNINSLDHLCILLGLQSARAAQRTDVLRVPVINLNNMAQNQRRVSSSSGSGADNRQNRHEIIKVSTNHRSSIDSDNDYRVESIYRSKQIKKYSTPMSGEENVSSTSDVDQPQDDGEDNDDPNRERRSSLLNENARRLLILGTIRPSRTFYKNISEADADHLMEYFRKMKASHQKLTSEEINQELSTKLVEYKPKICKF